MFVTPRREPLNAKKHIVLGSSPKDKGNLLLSENEYLEIIDAYPKYSSYIKKYIGTDEFLHSKNRYCLWLKNEKLDDLLKLPFIRGRIEGVRDFRLASKKEATRKSAETPHLFDEDRQQKSGDFILVPYTSSENRTYLPLGFYNPDVVISNLANMIINGDLFDLGLISSTMSLTWMRGVGGRLENRVRYSGQLVYNTFPWPDFTIEQKSQIEKLAEEILLIREDYPEMTMAQKYNPDTMPAPLLEAHQILDKAVEKLYRDKPFEDASERLAFLFKRYEELIAKEQANA